MRECIILIGLPGSGKTTLYRQRFAATHEHISKDLWPNVRNKQARQAQELAARLSSGASVVVDNTHAAVADRAPVIALARQHAAKVIGYFVDVPVKEAIARNAGREGRARVPTVAIYTIAKRLEPPTYVEGFDELHRVQPAGDGQFAIEKLAARI